MSRLLSVWFAWGVTVAQLIYWWRIGRTAMRLPMLYVICPSTLFTVLVSFQAIRLSVVLRSQVTGQFQTGSDEAGRWLNPRSRSGNGRNGHFLRWIIQEFWGARPWVALLAASVLGYALGHGALALAAGLLGRALVRLGDETGQTLPSGGRLLSTLLFGLLGSVVKGSAGVFLAVAESRLSGQVARSLYGRVLSGVLDEGPHDAGPTILATIAVRVREVESSVGAGAITGLRALVQVVPLGLTLIWLSPSLAAAGGLVVIPFGWMLSRVRGRLGQASERAQRLAESLHRGLDELVGNLDLFRTFGAGFRVRDAIDQTSERSARAVARFEGGRAALSGANEVLGALALLGAFALAAQIGVPFGDGTIVTFAAVFFMAYRPVRDLGDARAWCLRGESALGALTALLGSELTEPVSSSKAEPLAADASWENSRVGARPMLARLELEALGARDRGSLCSLVLEPGELLAVTGPTGSGKTTLLRVLLGLEAARGSVRYAGSDITRRGVGPSERPFAWVPQEAPLVSATVLENVALVGTSSERARQALAEIGADALVAHAGSDFVGPGGRPLSGGERRQVALARAMATGQPVLLLDEPTVGLDSDATRAVLAALAALRGRRSVLVVTHDPQLVRLCDRVVPIGASSDAVQTAQAT